MFGPGAVCKLWLYGLSSLTVKVCYSHPKKGFLRCAFQKGDEERYKIALEIIEITHQRHLLLLYGHANKSRVRSSDDLLLANILFHATIMMYYVLQSMGISVDDKMTRFTGRLILYSLEEALSVRQLATFSRNQCEGLLFLLLSTAASVLRFLRIRPVSNSFTLGWTVLTL